MNLTRRNEQSSWWDRAGGGAALDQGGVRGGSFSSFQVLGRPSESSHGIGFLADYRFYYPIGHVRGNFDLKTMTVRVRSGPLSLVSGP